MDTKTSIIAAADRLFYQKGVTHTSFGHIADEVGISKGNLTYHFKSKEDLLTAVINYRLAHTHAMLDQWDLAGETPSDRIHSFINILKVNQHKIEQFGCPVGTLSTELTKLSHPATASAVSLFSLFRHWLAHQFEQLGFGEQSDKLAIHLLALSQGVATIASAFNDNQLIDTEISFINQWLDSLLDSHNGR